MTSAAPGFSVPARNTAPEEVARKAEQARHAAGLWRRYSLSQRVELVRRVWKELLRQRGEIIRLVHEETGKPFAEIEMTEIAGVEAAVRYFTANAHRILQDQAAWRPWHLCNKRAYTRFMPRGLVGVISSWDLPFLGPLEDALAAMLAGNAVLIKPSEWTTRTALWAQEAVNASGVLPDGLFGVVTGEETVALELVDRCDMVLYAGDSFVGARVAQAAAQARKPAVMELGGKHSMIVFNDAALDRAAQAAVWGAFSSGGQLSTSVGRVFVETGVYDDFVAAARRRTAALRQGPGTEGVEVGRLVFAAQLKRVLDQLEDARRKGAQILGGEVLDEANLLISPAIVLNARQEMKVMTEEVPGPVLSIMKVESGEEAVALSNEAPFGLCASLWTRDLEKAERLGTGLETGVLGINDLASQPLVWSLPFGGVKASGIGRRRCDEGLRMFCWPQAVYVHEWPAAAAEMKWFPYKDVKTRLVRWMACF